jgi:hypothetical protein
MIVTQIAFTSVILLMVLAFVLVAFAEDVRPTNWTKLGRLDKALVVIVVSVAVAFVIGLIALIWGL